MAPRRRRPRIGKTGCLFWLFILLVIIVIFIYKGKGNLKEAFSFRKLKNIIGKEEQPPSQGKQIEREEKEVPQKKDDGRTEVTAKEETIDRIEKVSTQKKAETPVQTAQKEKPAQKTEIKTKKLTTSLYFVKISDDGSSVKPVPVTRTIEYKDSPITRTIESLLEGPTVSERQSGMMSFIPDDTRLISASLSDDHLTLNFSNKFEENYTGREAILLELSQVLLTSFNFSQVKKISILIDGTRRRYITGEGVPLKEVYTKQDLAELTLTQR